MDNLQEGFDELVSCLPAPTEIRQYQDKLNTNGIHYSYANEFKNIQGQSCVSIDDYNSSEISDRDIHHLKIDPELEEEFYEKMAEFNFAQVSLVKDPVNPACVINDSNAAYKRAMSLIEGK